jgi:hypothetical protein
MGNSSTVDENLAGQALLFLHIHKTAGTTLHRIIEREYNPFRIYTIEGGAIEWSVNHFKRLSEARRAGLQVVKGHMSFGLHEFLPQPSTYITFLRDPVDRWLSFYYYAKSDRLGPFYRRMVEENLDLPTLVRLAWWNNNLQCKQIAGIDRHEFRPISSVREMTRPGARPPEPDPDRWSNENTLKIAKQNLTRFFSFVGVTEQFDEGLVLLRHLFNWKFDSYATYRKSPKRPKREIVDAAVRAAIEERNALDRELYQFGQKMFADAASRVDVDLRDEATALRGTSNRGTVNSMINLGHDILRAAASRMVSLL